MTQSSATADSPNAEIWFVATADNGTVEYCLDDLIAAIQAGRVQAHHLVWRQGMGDWLEVEHVPLLRMIAGPAAVALAAPVAPVDPLPTLDLVQAAEEAEATIVQPRLDLLIDNQWTIEPKPEPKVTSKPEPEVASKPAPLSIHDLIDRGPSPQVVLSQGSPRGLLARPALLRPTTPRTNFAGLAPVRLPPREAAPDGSPNLPSRLSSRAPPKPVSSAPPKPLASANAARTEVPTAVVVSTRTPPASPISKTVTQVQSQPTVTGVGNGHPSPNGSPASNARGIVESPPVARALPSPVATVVKVPSQALVEPSVVLAAEIQPATAPPAAQSPVTIEPVGSLLPSVTSLYPDEPQWRKSRRPIFVAAGAAAAAAVIIIVAVGSKPGHSAKRLAAAPRTAPSALHESPPTPIVTASGESGAPPEPPGVAQAVSSESATSTTSAKPSKRIAATAARIADAARSPRKALRESDAPAVARPQVEPKAAPAESAGTSKATASNPKKPQGSASSVASWDEGTVEHRSWMNPGF